MCYATRDARTTILRLRENSKSLMDFTRAVYSAYHAYSDIQEYIDKKAAGYESDLNPGDGDLLYFSRVWGHPELI